MRRPDDASRSRKSRRSTTAERRARTRSGGGALAAAPAQISLGDLVALLHERAQGRGLTAAAAVEATARGLAEALARPANRRVRRSLGALSAE